MTQPLARGGAGLLFALVFLNILNFADRYLLIGFSPDIVGELKLTNLQFGLLTGLVFTGVYTVMGLFFGSLADRVHRPRLMAAGLTLWSALTAVTGMTTSFVQMAFARLFIGVGEACLTPSAISLLADRFPQERRAFASGVYYMGYPLGVGGSLIFAGTLGPLVGGWRGTFALMGALGIVSAVMVALFMRDPAREAARAGAAASTSKSFGDTFAGIGGELRSNGALSLTLLSCALLVFALGASIMDVLWWIKERGYTPAEAKTKLGWLFMLGGAFGAFLGGALGDLAARRWVMGRLKFLATAILVAAPLVTAYRLVPGHTLVFEGLAFLASITAGLLFGPALSSLQEMVPPQHRASIIAVFVLCTTFFGAGGGNACVGYLADTFTKSGTSDPITMAILWTGAPALLAIPGFFIAARMQARRMAAKN
jgi:MFS family permease